MTGGRPIASALLASALTGLVLANRTPAGDAYPDNLLVMTAHDSTNQALWVLTSVDGKTWVRTSETTTFTAPAAEGYLRDPSVIYRDGYWYIAYTAGDFGRTNILGIARSSNLVTWQKHYTLETGASNHYSWAPEFFEQGTNLHLLFTANTNAFGGGGEGVSLYLTRALDDTLTNWSPKTNLTASWPGWYNRIDPYILSIDGTNLLFHSDQIWGGTLGISRDTGGGFQFTNWVNFATGLTNIGEGPSARHLGNGHIIVWFDVAGGLQYYAVSTNYGLTWSASVRNGTPDGISHGTVYRPANTNAAAAIARLAGSTASTFARWKRQFPFPPGQEAEASDPDGDGLTNLAEFALGSDPTHNDAGQWIDLCLLTEGNLTYPAVTFRRNQNATGLTLEIQAASGLDFNSPLGLTLAAGSPLDLGNGREQVTYRTSAPIHALTNVFLNLRVLSP